MNGIGTGTSGGSVATTPAGAATAPILPTPIQQEPASMRMAQPSLPVEPPWRIGAGPTHDRSHAAMLDLFARAGAVLVACVATAVLFGWFLDIAVMKTLLPHLPTMKANTAWAFLAAAASLWSLNRAQPASRSIRLARVMGCAIVAIGAFTVLQDVIGRDFGIDQLIVSDNTDLMHPGRMAPATAVSLIFIGLAMLGLRARRSSLAACANWLAVPPLFLSTLAIVGYAYGVSSLYELGPFTPMALHTALSFFILALSIMAANPAHGIGNLLISETAGGAVARKLLPTIPLAIFALGWLRLEGQRAGLYDTPFGLALSVLLSIVLIVFAITSTAITLQKVDLTRRRAETELGDLNVRLDQRVQERTRELAQLSEELTAANASLEKLSLHDALSSLANRRFFDEYIAGQLAVARRQQRPLALVLIDIDDFKAYNDRYGHQAGDECLRNVAAALRSCCRRPADMAARYGGEEFALILPDTDMAGAVRIAETARDTVGRLRVPHAGSPTGRFVSISGGAAVLLPTVDATVEQLIAAADEHLFQAKRLGRNRIVPAQAEPALFAIAAGKKQ